MKSEDTGKMIQNTPSPSLLFTEKFTSRPPSQVGHSLLNVSITYSL